MQRYAVVVDPLAAGQDYPVAFAEAGVATVAVLAGPDTLNDPYYAQSWYPTNFAHVHRFDGDLAAMAALLRRYDPLCLIPGAETGVELADALVELVVPGSGHVPGLAAARRDKWAMAQAMGAAGVPQLRQLSSDSPDEVAAWLRATGLDRAALVLKPTKSAGTDNVHVVAAGEDWRPFFDLIYGQVNDLFIRNDAVLVQEFAAGTEYLVDSYSVDGVHALVDVCRYTKLQRGDLIGIYDLVDFLAPDPHRRRPAVAGGGHPAGRRRPPDDHQAGHRHQPHPAHRGAPGARRVRAGVRAGAVRVQRGGQRPAGRHLAQR